MADNIKILPSGGQVLGIARMHREVTSDSSHSIIETIVRKHIEEAM
jgi:hypothetical protein